MSKQPVPNPNNFESVFKGKNTHLFVLKNQRGTLVALTDYGARIVSILVPDKNGDLTDVVLGFDSIEGYYNANEVYHGCTAGRFANRIAHGKFTLDDQVYQLALNNGPNSLHGGPQGFHNQVWDRRINFENKVDFIYTSEDGEEGFPGKLSVHSSYELTEDNELIMRYQATTDKKTVINLTNHAFFNLNGENAGSILNHRLTIPSTAFLATNEFQIPTQITPVENTPFDFRQSKTIGESIHDDNEQLHFSKGYDHNFIVSASKTTACATAIGDLSGIRLDVYSDYPGIQFYSGNFLNGSDLGKQCLPYNQFNAFCLEGQFYPDSPNRPDFPSSELAPGETFEATITYKFGIDQTV